MSKILSIIKREYIQIVRTKGFVIGTILAPVFMAALIFVPILGQLVSVGKQETIGVLDLSQQVFVELEKKLDHKLKDGQRRYLLREYKPTANVESLRDALSKEVLDKTLNSYIYIPQNISEGGVAEYAALHTTDLEELKSINSALNSVVIEHRLKNEGLDPQKIAQYIRPVRLTSIKVTKKGEEKDTGGTWLISYFLALILYMTLFFYGAIIMRGVIEEKTSRVVEVILSSVKPFHLMVGKILGIGAVGLTQYSIWALFGFAASRYSKSALSFFTRIPADLGLPSIPVYVFIYFVIFFILGYFLFGTMYAAVGSMVNSEKEAQQLLMPITMFLIVPLMLILFIMRSPDSSFSVILSLIPFFAPILMLLRVSVLLPPFIQVGGSIVILVLSIVLMMWLTAKIYRVGILMYGKRPNFKEVVKWLRYK
jgi:ABC-2 type transport system permease protein